MYQTNFSISTVNFSKRIRVDQRYWSSPPDKMNTSTLFNTWSAREKEIRQDEKALRMKKLSDKLYEQMVATIGADLSNIHDQLNDTCKTAASRSQLSVPIWDFKTRYFLKTEEEEREPFWETSMGILGYSSWKDGRDREIDARGYHDCVDGVPVRVILRETDVLDRVTAKLFGVQFFKIKVRNISEDVDTALGLTVVTRRLYLHFFPKGLSDEDVAQLQAVVWKYQPTTPTLTTVPPDLPPPLAPIKRSKAEHHYRVASCFCGCEDDDSDAE